MKAIKIKKHLKKIKKNFVPKISFGILTKKVTKNSSDLINKLKDLKELRDNDVLTDEEFLKAKKKLLE